MREWPLPTFAKRGVFVSQQYVIELKHITKKFPGVVAMRNMHIQIKPGEIHGLVGENGAGKSTLIKVLTGVHIPEEGEIYVEGKRHVFRNPVQAREAGIACVYQELNIVKMLPVVDNVFMGRKVTNKFGLLDYPYMHEETKKALAALGHTEIDTRMECGKLGVGQQQMVEIAKAITQKAKLIIMDEPTSSLGEQEVQQLVETVRRLKDRGIAILFVSHKLEELFELC
jgi:ribose transport system ATP-binding protein